MPSNKHIEDPDIFYMLNSIGSMKLSYVGSLLKIWENKTKEGLVMTFPEWVMKEEFVEATESHCKIAKADIVALQKELSDLVGGREKDMSALRKELGVVGDFGESLQKEWADTRADLAESKRDIFKLTAANEELRQKYDQLETLIEAATTLSSPPASPPASPSSSPSASSPASPSASPSASARISIDDVRRILSTFNRKNPVAVANGDPSGVKFDGHVKITSVESLTSFLSTECARKLGLPSDILVAFKVFVADGKLVTLSDDYHGGVGYSYLWKMKKSSKSSVEGWATPLAKKCDPRLAIDPATGVQYIDPQTGKTWVCPEPVESVGEKKRSGDESGDSAPKKRMRDESSSSSSGQSEAETESEFTVEASGVVAKEEEREVFI